MEEEKDTPEKEEEEEEEEERRHHHTAAASSTDHHHLPIMHWEDLSQRIAELEEQECRERSKGAGGVWTDVWEEDEEDFRKRRVAVVASRYHKHRNLQLCFVNNSDSEDEQEKDEKEVAMGAGRSGCHASGLKQEVVVALRTLRDKVLAEQKEKEPLTSGAAKRNHLERQELWGSSMPRLNSLRASLQQDVHALSSELVSLLLVRDQLRTKQDAMLLDVQDLT